MYRDDDELFIPSSEQEYFTQADHGVDEAKKEKAKSKGQLLRLQRDLLATNVEQKKAEMTSDDASAGVKDEETKKERQRRKEEEEKSKKGITLSLKEMEEAEIDSAGKKQTAEDLIQKEEQEEAAQSDSEEYMAQAG